ncbi:uncharacterized protein LOC118237743 [Cricetulus griseus]|uniref:Uncharacterized protein LOC118237743 n=1 Tax=Cricetulus griseus TaxID=10029 RepID=A0A9J7GNI8_CRIGR|nr:uncharacterized protein LOC118237743 [Cricetulus griseus]
MDPDVTIAEVAVQAPQIGMVLIAVWPLDTNMAPDLRHPHVYSCVHLYLAVPRGTDEFGLRTAAPGDVLVAFEALGVRDLYFELGKPSALFGEGPRLEGFAIFTGDEEGGPPSSTPSQFLLSTLCRNRAAKVCSVLFGLCFVAVICVLLSLETMGQTVTTPLSLTLSHWRDVQEYAHNQSVDVRKRKWITLCSSEWPTFDVGWPRDGTFNPQTIFQVKEKIMDPGPHGHPDQVAYIVTWEALVQDPPPWVRPFLHPKGPSLLPPSNRSNRPIPSAPTPPTPLIPPNPPSHSNLYPTAVKDTKAKEKKTPKVLPPGEDQLVDLLTEEPPPYPPLPPPPEAEADSAAALAEAAPDPSPMAYRLRGRREQPVPDSTTLPLRTGLNGQPQYWPFSASDLYNWKNNNPSFSADPVRLTSLIESVLTTHQPTWDDCQQLLQVLLTSACY